MDAPRDADTSRMLRPLPGVAQPARLIEYPAPPAPPDPTMLAWRAWFRALAARRWLKAVLRLTVAVLTSSPAILLASRALFCSICAASLLRASAPGAVAWAMVFRVLTPVFSSNRAALAAPSIGAARTRTFR